MTKQKVYTTSQALDRAKVYCSKAEHNQKEVLLKLREWGLNLEEAESVLSELISQNYVNEERYAKLYSKSKFNQNQWGRVKIRHHLNQMGVSERNIQKGLEEISEEEYEAHEFAGAFLMPETEFREVAESFRRENKYQVISIADHFGVSVDAASTRGRWLRIFAWD